MGFFLAIFLSIATSSTVYGNNLDLPTAISETQSGSLVLKKFKAITEEQSWKKIESYSLHLPSLTLTGSYLLDHKYLYTDMSLGAAPTSVPAVVPTTNYYLTLLFPLFDGFSGLAKTQAAKSMEAAAQADYQFEQFKAEKEVTLQFYKTLSAMALRDVAEQNLKTLTDHLSDVKKYKAAGLSTNFDVLRLEVQVSEANTELLNTEDSIEINKNKLAELMGQSAELRTLKGDLPALKSELIEKIKKDSIQNRLDLKALHYKLQASQEMSRSSNRYWVPKVNLLAQYQYYNNRNDQFSDYANFRDAFQVGVTLNWSLFDGMSSIAKSHESAEQEYQLEKTYQLALLKAEHDFDFWKRRFLYFTSVYSSRESDIRKSEESVRLAKEGRRVGSRTNSDMLDAELELFRARAGLVTSQIGAIEALVQLELSSNVRLFDFTKGMIQ